MRWPAAAVDRRTLLIGGGAGIGLIVAYAAWPRRAGSPLRAARGETVFGPYLRISDKGVVTVAVPQAETGQGAWTALAHIAADELGAAWDSVAAEPAPFAPTYTNRLVGDEIGVTTRLTARSSSVRAFEGPLREAGAMARALLCAAAAARWGISADRCDARDGMVSDGTRALPFGDLAVEAASVTPPPLSLRPRGSGQSRPRLDLPAKSDGSLRFAGDVRLPGMRFAAIRFAPPGGRLVGFARPPPHDARTVTGDDWLAAIAETSWAANRALAAAAPRFTGLADADTPAIEAALTAALVGPMTRFAEHGDYDAAVEGRRPLAATYTIAPAPHLSLEPSTAAVRLADGRLEVWAGTRVPDLVRAAAARAAGLPADQVTLYPLPLGDGGGGAIDTALVEAAIAVARATGAPISLSVNGATAQNQDACRPPLAARLSALPDGGGGIAAWHGRFAAAAGLESAVARAAGRSQPDFTPRGAAPPYTSGALRIESASVALPLGTGYLRGDVEALTAFANESFIDELARARGVEPLAFRIGLLAGAPRLARVLTTAAARGGWDGGARGSSLGIAGASAFGSFIALVAEAGIGGDQRIMVSRLVAAVDAGRLIDPGLVRQQIEGGLLHALATATGPAPEIVAGMPRARPLAALGLGTLKAVPRIEVVLVPSTARSGGVSGLPATVLAAAVGNAIFAATDLRLRRLPFDPMSPA